MALAPRTLALPEPASSGIRRRYINGAFGQIHLRVAPAAGGKNAPPLLLLHQTALSGRMFDQFLPYLATDRTVIALDTPGYGESDRPQERPSISAYADAIADAVAREFGMAFDVLGYHTGAAIAADMAARRAEVARCVLVSMPYFAEVHRKQLVTQVGDPDDPVEDYAEDGSHLLAPWQGSYRSRAEGQSLDDVARLVAEKQRAGRFGAWALLSALEADLEATLSAIDKPTLVIAPHDGLQEESRAAAKAISNAKLHEMPNHAYGLFDAAPQELAEIVNRFLKR